MALYVDVEGYSESRFQEQRGAWDASQLPDPLRRAFSTYSICTAPPKKHSLEECPRFEAEWRRIVTDVLFALQGEDLKCVVWAEGNFESDGVQLVMRYADDWNDKGLRYYVEGFTYPGGRGFWRSSVGFEFHKDVVVKMVMDESIDFEFVELTMVLCLPNLIPDILSKPFEHIGLEWILTHDALGVVSIRHFEGCHVVGLTDTVGAAMGRLRRFLGPSCVAT